MKDYMKRTVRKRGEEKKSWSGVVPLLQWYVEHEAVIKTVHRTVKDLHVAFGAGDGSAAFRRCG